MGIFASRYAPSAFRLHAVASGKFQVSSLSGHFDNNNNAHFQRTHTQGGRALQPEQLSIPTGSGDNQSRGSSRLRTRHGTMLVKQEDEIDRPPPP